MCDRADGSSDKIVLRSSPPGKTTSIFECMKPSSFISWNDKSLTRSYDVQFFSGFTAAGESGSTDEFLPTMLMKYKNLPPSRHTLVTFACWDTSSIAQHPFESHGGPANFTALSLEFPANFMRKVHYTDQTSQILHQWINEICPSNDLAFAPAL